MHSFRTHANRLFAPGIKTWIEELPMSKAAEAVQRVKDNKIKYRFVLKMDL